MSRVSVILAFEGCVANRAIGWCIAVHAAIDDRPKDASVICAGAFEEAYILIVVPSCGLSPLIVVGAIAHTRGYGRSWINKVAPLQGGTIGINRHVNLAGFATRVC